MSGTRDGPGKMREDSDDQSAGKASDDAKIRRKLPSPEQQRAMDEIDGATSDPAENQLFAEQLRTLRAMRDVAAQQMAAAELKQAGMEIQGHSPAAYPEIMTIEQVGEYLQLHPQVVYRHVRAGTLPASRIGRTIRFKKSVLDAFLEKDAWAAAGKFLAFAEGQKMLHQPSQTENVDPSPAVQPSPKKESDRPRRQFSADVD